VKPEPPPVKAAPRIPNCPQRQQSQTELGAGGSQIFNRRAAKSLQRPITRAIHLRRPGEFFWFNDASRSLTFSKTKASNAEIFGLSLRVEQSHLYDGYSRTARTPNLFSLGDLGGLAVKSPSPLMPDATPKAECAGPYSVTINKRSRETRLPRSGFFAVEFAFFGDFVEADAAADGDGARVADFFEHHGQGGAVVDGGQKAARSVP
jgi:hypothetical protein